MVISEEWDKKLREKFLSSDAVKDNLKAYLLVKGRLHGLSLHDEWRDLLILTAPNAADFTAAANDIAPGDRTLVRVFVSGPAGVIEQTDKATAELMNH